MRNALEGGFTTFRATNVDQHHPNGVAIQRTMNVSTAWRYSEAAKPTIFHTLYSRAPRCTFFNSEIECVKSRWLASPACVAPDILACVNLFASRVLEVSATLAPGPVQDLSATIAFLATMSLVLMVTGAFLVIGQRLALRHHRVASGASSVKAFGAGPPSCA